MKHSRFLALAAIPLGLFFGCARHRQPAAVERATANLESLSPGHKALGQFRRGVNLGNYLEAPKGQNWGARYTEQDFDHIKAEGFDHVRLPMRWNDHAGAAPDFKLSGEIFGKADFLVTNALKRGLAVIVNIHHFDEFTTDPPGQTEKFLALWKQIAAHYKSSPASLAFELLNEPKDNATTVVMNPIYARAIAVIRETNPGRAIFVGPGKWNSVDELKNLLLPAGDRNLIVTVHCYEPFLFTHQGASWTGNQTRTKGIVFPGPPATPIVPHQDALTSGKWVSNWFNAYNTKATADNPVSAKTIAEKMRRARDWARENERPVHVGEFGCYVGADAESRTRFHNEFVRILNEYDLAWALWDWKAGFRYWDEKANGPAPGMRQALFGRK
jgi:endoglucanase